MKFRNQKVELGAAFSIALIGSILLLAPLARDGASLWGALDWEQQSVSRYLTVLSISECYTIHAYLKKSPLHFGDQPIFEPAWDLSTG